MLTPTAAAVVGSSMVLFCLVQKIPLKKGRGRQTVAQPPVWQDMPREHGLHFKFLDAQGLFSCGFRAITACRVKSSLEWAPWAPPSRCHDGQGLLQLGKEL